MRISDWSSDVCSSDLIEARLREDSGAERLTTIDRRLVRDMDENRIVGASDSDPFQQSLRAARLQKLGQLGLADKLGNRSEEHTSELQSLMRISYAVFCLKKKKDKKNHT